MKLLNKMERKYGRYAISNLPLYLVAILSIGYVLKLSGSPILSFCAFDTKLILKGQIWRLISWILIPGTMPDIFSLIMLYFYYCITKAMERAWGAFRLNVYIFAGVLFPVIGAFIFHFIFGAVYHIPFSGLFLDLPLNNYYLELSLMLAFTVTYPDEYVLLYFLIPLKMKWLGAVFGLMLLFDFVMISWAGKFLIFVSMLHFLILFGYILYYRRYRMGHRAAKKIIIDFQPKRDTASKEKANETTRTRNQMITRHKCAVCGKTEQDDPDMEFRFCSKCNGNYEYCRDHIFTHTHVE